MPEAIRVPWIRSDEGAELKKGPSVEEGTDELLLIQCETFRLETVKD